MSQQVQLRRDTAANWVTANPTLAQGEVGIEYDTRRIKVGDGSTAWNSLAYATVGGPTLTYNVVGKSTNAERYVIGRSPVAFTVSGTNTNAEAYTAATASTVYTLKKRSGGSTTTIGTFTFAASGTVATTSISAGAVLAGDFLFIDGPATADTTLADIGFVVAG
jgi:hypothetical protein